MMIEDSPSAYYFIRALIFFLHYLVPACLLCTAGVLARYGLLAARWQFPLAVELYALAESLFYLFGYLPYKAYLQREARHPPLLSREGRRALFDQCHYNVPDVESYLQKWFLGARPEDIKRDNLKEFFLWAFFNRAGEPGDDDEELEEYIQTTEELLGRKVDPGRGPAKCLRLTLDKVDMLHRSLAWYTIVGLVDVLTYLKFTYNGLQWHRGPLSSFFTVVPFRPQIFLSSSKSPSKRLTYFYRPHTSKTKLPIIFFHGVGIGLGSYDRFLKQLMGPDGVFSPNPDDQVGIILFEILPVSFRICPTMILSKDQMCTEVSAILRHYGWSRVVLTAHSYGSAIATHLLKSPLTARLIGPILLIDPVTVMLHLPDVAYNFTRRPPKSTSELQLHYFASMDASISHALGRHFFWAENILWLADLKDRDITFSLAGRDLIINTTAVGRYLTTGNPAGNVKRQMPTEPAMKEADDEVLGDEDDDVLIARQLNGHLVKEPHDVVEVEGKDRVGDDAEEWKRRSWKGKGIDVLWYETLDHASVFNEEATLRPLVHVIKTYCRQGAGAQSG